MAGHANSTRRGALSIFSATVRRAEIARQELDEAVATVKRVMEAAHGGRWNISINHESCFVLVAREFDPTEMEIIKNRWPSVDG